MDFDNASLYSELCRLCLENRGVYDLFKKMDLVQDIYLCTGVQVIVSHNWPRKICTKCLEIVTNAKQLRLLAAANESRLKVLFEDDDSALQIDETCTSNEKDGSVDADGSCAEDKNKTDEEDDNERIIGKRQRSSSAENDELLKKIAVRKDLFKSSKSMPSPIKNYTYIEGTKYGISKRYSINNEKEVEITYTCAWCPKTFPSWKKVYCHQRLHNKHIPCPIEACRKKFAAKGDLEKHIRTHTGERPYSCDVCDKSFSQRITLRLHKENVHQKENIIKKESEQDEESSDGKETLVVY